MSRRRITASFVVLCAVITLFTTASAVSEPFEHGGVARLWGIDSGLPHAKVCAVERSSNGYLWLGTPAGLVRFDGVRFEVYDHLNTPILDNSRILCLSESGSGKLWVGTDGGGLYSLRNGEWTRYGYAEGLTSNHIRAIEEDGAGNLWVGTEYGLHQLYEDGVRIIGLDEGLADNLITSLAVDGLGRIWAGTMRGGLAMIESTPSGVDAGTADFSSRHVRLYDYDDGLEDMRVLAVAAGPDGRVWIGTMGGLFCLEPDGRVVRPAGWTGGYPVTSLAVGSDGELLIGTMVEGLKMMGQGPAGNSSKGDSAPEGLLRTERISPIVELLEDGDLYESYVCSILQDDEGFLWVGTESHGLVQLKEGSVGSVTAADGLPPGAVYPLLEDEDGAIWLGTEKEGLYRFRKGRVELVSDRGRGLAGDMVRTLMIDRSGALWVGTMDGGVSVLMDGRIRTLTTEDGLPSDVITVLLQDGEGVVWIGTDRGLGYRREVAIEETGSVEALSGRTIRSLHESRNGMLRAGTRRGVWLRSGPFFERISADGDSVTFDVLSIHENEEGALWVGTNGSGLVRIYDGETTTFTTADGLPGNFIFSITETAPGLLWISCEQGLFSISADSLDAFARGAVPMLAPTLYDERDGMPSSRCSGFCQPAVCLSRSGELLYPTDAGIAVLDPGKEGEPSRSPTVRIEKIIADDISISITDNVKLDAGTDRLEIRFTAFDYAAPEKLRFLYSLDGFDASVAVLHPGAPRHAVYNDLPPGGYVFSVYAIANGGLWSKRAATARFVILPPFYRTRTFLFIVIAALALTAGSVMIISRYKRLEKRRMKYSTTSISEERMKAALAELEELMEVERVYLDPDLTLQKLAKRLRIHYNHLSRIINERFETSFKNYINRYRIEEAKRRLSDPGEEGRNIQDIMLDAGFYSKSTFNTAFRKFTGTSPSKYRKKNS